MSCDEDEDLFGGSDEDDGEVEDEDEVEDGGASGSSGGSPGGGGAVQQSSRVECTSGLDTLWSTYGKNPDGSIIVTTSGKHVGKQKHDKVSTGRKFSDGSDDWYEFVWIHRPNAPFTYKWSSKITDSHKLGTALNSHINRYIKGNTTGLDGLATGQQAFVDVAAHAQAALPHLQAIASAAQTGNRALNTAAVNMGGTVVPLPSSSTSAPLCAAAPSSAASQLAPSGSTGAAQPNAAPAAASDNRFRKGSSLQDTDVTRLLGAGGDDESSSDSDGSEETDEWTCPTPKGSKFVAQGDPTDFAVIAAKEPWSGHLLVFNDNFRDRNTGQGGSGNATVRPFFEQTPRRTVGLSTGWTPAGGFATRIAGSLEKECIDLSLDKVYLVAKESRAAEIIFSCGDDPNLLAVELFKDKIDPMVVQYISDGLRSLPQRGSSIRFKTVAEVLEAERQLEARAPRQAHGMCVYDALYVLGFRSIGNPSDWQIDRMWRKLRANYHPDKHNGRYSKAFYQLTEARDVLKKRNASRKQRANYHPDNAAAEAQLQAPAASGRAKRPASSSSDEGAGGDDDAARKKKKMGPIVVTSSDLQLKHGDFVKMLLTFSDAFFDLILIDPPTGASSKNRTQKDDYDNLWDNWDEVARAIKQKLAPTGSVVVMPGSQQGETKQSVYCDATAAFKKEGFRQASFTWEKYNAASPYNGHLNHHKHKPLGSSEPLLVFSTQIDTSYKQNGQTTDKIVALQHKPTEYHAGIKHLKPLELYDELYKMFCPAGAAVCDGTLHTGIAAVAAHKRSLRFVGIEKSREYLDHTKCRLLREKYGRLPSRSTLPNWKSDSRGRFYLTAGNRKLKKRMRAAMRSTVNAI